MIIVLAEILACVDIDTLTSDVQNFPISNRSIHSNFPLI